MEPSDSTRGDLQRIVARWRDAVTAWQVGEHDRDRDSAILRFELAYELAWKLLQRLAHAQGLASAGPRQAFAHAFQLGWIEDETVWFDILQARNQAVHVYRETAATALATELPRYLAAFEQLLERLPKL
ncbi:MAG: hypothetical protein EXS37_10815 [Opitutus sp.]|nr:hypothetical protein [Opitutus sp.]